MSYLPVNGSDNETWIHESLQDILRLSNYSLHNNVSLTDLIEHHLNISDLLEQEEFYYFYQVR